MTYLGRYFKRKRLAARLSLGKVAGMIGYRNLNKGCKRIQQLENEGYCEEELLAKLGAALGVNDETIVALIQEDIDANEEWLDAHPVEPHLVLRYMAAVYGQCNIPDSIKSSLDESIRFASDKAVEIGLRVCLVWSHRLSIYYDRDGKEEGRSEKRPYMSIKGRRFLLGSSET